MATTTRSAPIAAMLALALATAGTLGATSPAGAAPPATVPTAWTIAAGGGTVSLPGVSGFPAGQVATNGSGASAPSGSSAFLGAGTPYGAAFGSTQGQPYFTVGTEGSSPSTTTITFPSAIAAGGWGFALGDVDADRVQITGTTTGGDALTAADLGFQGTFNSCAASPRPSSCDPPYTDLPTWDAGTATLNGSGTNTTGAAGWFRPTVPVASLTFTFSLQVGFPTYQLWISGLAASASGTVTLDVPDPPPPTESTVELQTPAGDPVPGPDGEPVVARPEADGSFILTDVLAGQYVAHIEPPAGVDADPVDLPIDLREGDVTGLTATLLPAQPATTTTTATPSTTTPTTTAAPGVAASTTTAAPSSVTPVELARTGSGSAPWAALGVALVVVGALVLRTRRRFT